MYDRRKNLSPVTNKNANSVFKIKESSLTYI